MKADRDWRVEHAKNCIAVLEMIRREIVRLSKMVSRLKPEAGRQIHGYADWLKDWREVLEEFIPSEYDVGK